jgi:hypothetical protein
MSWIGGGKFEESTVTAVRLCPVNGGESRALPSFGTPWQAYGQIRLGGANSTILSSSVGHTPRRFGRRSRHNRVRSDEIVHTRSCSITRSAFPPFDQIDNARRFGTKTTYRLMDWRPQ